MTLHMTEDATYNACVFLSHASMLPSEDDRLVALYNASADLDFVNDGYSAYEAARGAVSASNREESETLHRGGLGGGREREGSRNPSPSPSLNDNNKDPTATVEAVDMTPTDGAGEATAARVDKLEVEELKRRVYGDLHRSVQKLSAEGGRSEAESAAAAEASMQTLAPQLEHMFEKALQIRTPTAGVVGGEARGNAREGAKARPTMLELLARRHDGGVNGHFMSMLQYLGRDGSQLLEWMLSGYVINYECMPDSVRERAIRSRLWNPDILFDDAASGSSLGEWVSAYNRLRRQAAMYGLWTVTLGSDAAERILLALGPCSCEDRMNAEVLVNALCRDLPDVRSRRRSSSGGSRGRSAGRRGGGAGGSKETSMTTAASAQAHSDIGDEERADKLKRFGFAPA